MTTNTSVSTRKPTAQQAMLIKLAMRKQGVTRPEVREALGYEAGVNIPVQTILKTLAARFGFEFITEDAPSPNNGKRGPRWMSVYGFRPTKATPVAALKIKSDRKVAK